MSKIYLEGQKIKTKWFYIQIKSKLDHIVLIPL